MAQDLTKRTMMDHLQALKPGDPWSILHDGNLLIDFEDGRGPRQPEVGEIVSRWYSTREPGREFEITAVHPKSVETKFIGFTDYQVATAAE